MLIGTSALETAVISNDIPRRMLPGSANAGVTGLAVLADRLRTPFSVKHTDASPRDFSLKGAISELGL